MSLFFRQNIKNKTIEKICFFIYFFINSFVYLYFSNVPFNILSNVFCLFILTFLYKGKLSTRILAVVLIFSINLFCENIVFRGCRLFHVTFIKVVSFVLSNVLFACIVFGLDKVIMLESKQEISLKNWTVIFSIPTISMLIPILMIFTVQSDLFIVLIAFVLLIINILLFYLYHIILKSYQSKYEKHLLEEQNRIYLYQIRMMQEYEENISLYKHDVKNHIIALKKFLEEKDIQSTENYLSYILQFLGIEEEIIETSNKELNSLLNYKLHIAKKNNIKIKRKITIPQKLNITAFDFNIIVGNLFDNALEALEKCEDKRVEVYIFFDRNVLYITMKNTYTAILVNKEGLLKTIKEDEKNHGKGLVSIKKIIDKYDGLMNINYEGDMFQIAIMLYN